MWKKYLVLLLATIGLIIGSAKCLNTPSLKSWWAWAGPMSFLILIYAYTRVWKWVFRSFYRWLGETAYQRQMALQKNGRIYMKPSPTTDIKKVLPPPAPKPRKKDAISYNK